VSSRRELLIGRFRAGSLDRIRRMSLILIKVQEGTGFEQLEELSREIHTLKGESRMLGFADISDLAHESEEVLGAGRGAPPTPEQCARLIDAFELISRALRGELGGDEEAHLVLARRRETMRDPAPAKEVAGEQPPPAAAAKTVPPPQLNELELRERREQREQRVQREQRGQREQRDKWVQVNARRIDELCERISDFDADFNAIRQSLRELARSAFLEKKARPLLEDLDRAETKLQDITNMGWALRLVPVAPTLEDLAKHAHDLATKLEKKVHVSVRGGEAQIERTVLDALWDPMLHLVRNAIDHGIEHPSERAGKPPRASLLIQAESVGPNVIVSIVDDGRGIDPRSVREAAVTRGLLGAEAASSMSDREVMDLLFVHGFSTRAQVGELSGRGVGLDVVRDTVEALGGSASLESQPHHGTRVALSLPAAIGKERALVIPFGDLLYGIPSRDVVEILPEATAHTEPVAGGRILRHRDVALPLRSMGAALGAAASADGRFVLVVQHGGVRSAFSVPSLLGDRELVRRPVDPVVIATMHVHASAILSDGKLVLLLTVPELLRRSERAAETLGAPGPARRQPRVLVVDDSPIVREVVTEILRGGGFEPHALPDGTTALDYLDGNPVDVAVLDVDMPGMNGLELLQRIRVRWQRLPVVMLTTQASPEIKRQALSLGADAYVVKAEFLEGSLLKTVRRFAGD
jgi:two-component system chemotaxis sensor kinase CheA/two-component system sensor histidine kinase and response regulator WspE